MTPTLLHRVLLIGLLLLSVPGAAAGQSGTRAIALESGLSTPIGSAGASTRVPVALEASLWLEGELEGVARICWAAAGEPADRGAAVRLAGTAGLRWSLGLGPVRPQLFAEVGWAWRGGLSPARGLALGAGLSLAWAARRDLELVVGAALRRAAGEPVGEVLGGIRLSY